MPGLGLELGSSAINDTPREMIKKNVKLWLERLHIAKQPNPILITISIPGGEEIAKRTFNPASVSKEAFPLSGPPAS